MIEQAHIEVTKTARYAWCGDAAASSGVWIACHGYRQLAARFLRPFDAAGVAGTLFVAPEGLNRFYVGDPDGVHGPETRVGATWMTREDRESEIADYVRYLDRIHAKVVRRRETMAPVIALGFSQGTATAARWVAMGQTAVDHLVLWAGGVPADLDLARYGERLRGLRSVVLVAGTADPWAAPERLDAERARLAAHGVPARVLTFDGEHRIDAATVTRLSSDLA